MAATANGIDPEGVLIVRSPADEASGLLITGQFASQITVRVFLTARRMYTASSRSPNDGRSDGWRSRASRPD